MCYGHGKDSGCTRIRCLYSWEFVSLIVMTTDDVSKRLRCPFMWILGVLRIGLKAVVHSFSDDQHPPSIVRLPHRQRRLSLWTTAGTYFDFLSHGLLVVCLMYSAQWEYGNWYNINYSDWLDCRTVSCLELATTGLWATEKTFPKDVW